MTYNVYANGSKTVRAFLRFSLAGCLEHFQMHVCMYVLRICELHTPWMLRFGMGWGWGHVHVHLKLHTPVMLRCSSSDELHMPWMLRCSSSCEVAHTSNAMVFKFM